jgi:hypothetical protein
MMRDSESHDRDRYARWWSVPCRLGKHKTRWREFLCALLALIEFDCAGNAVSGAASKLALIVNRRALGSKVNRRGQSLRETDEWRGIHKIALP